MFLVVIAIKMNAISATASCKLSDVGESAMLSAYASVVSNVLMGRVVGLVSLLTSPPIESNGQGPERGARNSDGANTHFNASGTN